MAVPHKATRIHAAKKHAEGSVWRNGAAHDEFKRILAEAAKFVEQTHTGYVRALCSR